MIKMIIEMFPLFGNLKEPFLILEWLVFFIILELSIFLAIKLKKKEKETTTYGEIGYIYLSLGYSLMWMFLIIGDHYITQNILREHILKIGFFILVLAALFFISATEKKHLIYKKYIFSISYSIFIIIYLFIWFLKIELAIIISSSFWTIFIIYIIFHYRDLYKNYYIKGEVRKTKMMFLKFIIGLSSIIIGYVLIRLLTIFEYYLFYRFIGNILQIIGAIFLFIFFSEIPSLSELYWKKRLVSFYIILKSGLLIYYKHFRSETNYLESSLKSGGIVSVEMILENITDSNGISLIERKDKKIIIHSGKYLYGVLISDEILRSHQFILRNIILKIEHIFSPILSNWQGDLKVFSPIDNIIEDMLK